jgi:DNA-directed RNA polymerase specialized sigma24 family protein
MSVLLMETSAAAVGEDFDGFYAAHFRDTVAMAYTLTADIGEAQDIAQDIAQEAFCQAWQRWRHVRGHENPVASVRHVLDRVGTQWLAVGPA